MYILVASSYVVVVLASYTTTPTKYYVLRTTGSW
jgi:hypothetical protein